MTKNVSLVDDPAQKTIGVFQMINGGTFSPENGEADTAAATDRLMHL